MATRSNNSNNDGGRPPRPLPQSQPAGPGGGGKARTRTGTGDEGGFGGDSWQGMDASDREPGRKILYSHLKDMAIDALEMSGTRDEQTIARSISAVLGSYDMQSETADVLASMVVAAYSCAKEVQDDRAVFLAYSCFSDAQLNRILKLARSK